MGGGGVSAVRLPGRWAELAGEVRVGEGLAVVGLLRPLLTLHHREGHALCLVLGSLVAHKQSSRSSYITTL